MNTMGIKAGGGGGGMRGGRRGECLSSSVLNQVLPSEAHWKEPQECSFGDSFRKAPKGHWRKARGRAHFPALAKVRQIIESLFLGFPVFHCTEEDGGRGGGGEDGWRLDGGSVHSPACRWGGGLAEAPRFFLSSLGSLGKEQRKNDRETDMLDTCVHEYTHAALPIGSQ